MKTKFHYYFILAFALAFSAPKADAQALIHFWDFNTGTIGDSVGNATNPLPASYTVLSSANPHIVYSRPYSPNMYLDSITDIASGGSFYYDYSSNSAYFSTSDSAGGNNFIKVRNPNANAYLIFYIPTTGYKNIMFNYALSASSSKAPNSVFSYSTNGGTSWNPLTAAMDTFNTGGRMHPDTLQNVDSVTVVSGWRPVSINFTSDPNVNSNAGFILRMTSAGLNDTLHSGNLRLDNVAVLGTLASGIDNLTAEAAGYNVYPNPVQNSVNVTSDNYTGSKTITIYDVVGQTISVTENKDKQTSIN
ncbi:MAG TPA: T9SS type A sorting domain-containing protein, partial [Bacteroidia bacterium]|nr:T9SS type A sorting domain-containing protein [Bacteroidia bacterium]